MNPEAALAVTGKLLRSRRRAAAPVAVSVQTQSAPRIARMLALAHYLEQLVQGGELSGYAEVSRKLGLTRARMSQIVSLLNLSPGIQEAILSGRVHTSERKLRAVIRMPNWTEQAAVLGA